VQGATPTAAIQIDVAKDRTPARTSYVTILVRAPAAQTIMVPVEFGE
jgi:hypothetical protein